MIFLKNSRNRTYNRTENIQAKHNIVPKYTLLNHVWLHNFPSCMYLIIHITYIHESLLLVVCRSTMTAFNILEVEHTSVVVALICFLDIQQPFHKASGMIRMDPVISCRSGHQQRRIIRLISSIIVGLVASIVIIFSIVRAIMSPYFRRVQVVVRRIVLKKRPVL